MKKKLIFATGNEGKMKEIREILGDLDYELLSMKEAGVDIDIVEDGTTFEENAIIKAKTVMEATGSLVLADDSGLEVDYLNKEPGVYSARYMGENTSYRIKNQIILDRLHGVPDIVRSARFVCVIAAAFPDGRVETRRATIEGRIAQEPAGENGFGYDPIFYLPEKGKTTAQPDNGEQALEIAETMIRSGALDIVIVDSVAALVPKAEIEGDMDDQQVGLHARLMSKAMRKLTGVINRSNCAVVFINQLREKVGIMFGNPEVTTGGRALKFYSSVRMDVRRVEAIKQGGEIIGNHTKVKVVKNKVAPPFKEAEFDIMFGQGISREGDLIDLAVKVDAVQKSGAWYAYKGEKIGQGRENAKTFLREHPEIMAEVEVQVREYYNLPTDTVVESASQEEGQPKAGDNQNGQFDSITTEE